MTSIRICGESFCGTLNIIFKTCLNTGKFQLELSEYINIYIYTFFLQISQDLDLDLADFPCKRKQGVVLNGQCSCRADVRTGVPLRSIFGTFLLFIYVNDLSDGLINECKQCRDDISLFSVVHEVNTSEIGLTEDSKKKINSDIHWKMNFNLDPNQKTQ